MSDLKCLTVPANSLQNRTIVIPPVPSSSSANSPTPSQLSQKHSVNVGAIVGGVVGGVVGLTVMLVAIILVRRRRSRQKEVPNPEPFFSQPRMVRSEKTATQSTTVMTDNPPTALPSFPSASSAVTTTTNSQLPILSEDVRGLQVEVANLRMVVQRIGAEAPPTYIE